MVPGYCKNIKPVIPTIGIVFLLILAVFVMEISIKEILSSLLSGISKPFKAFIHSTVMVLLYSAPLWAMLISPLFKAQKSITWKHDDAITLFIKALAVIFLVEFVVVFSLPHLLPGMSDEPNALIDASLDMMISVPLLWWLLIKPATLKLRVPIVHVLETPVKLYIILLFVVFMGDFVESITLPLLMPIQDSFVDKLVDNFFFTMISAPFLWYLLIRPLQKAAQCESERAETLQAQVMDAVISIDEKGIIDSFNPAAERKLGYPATEVIGRNVSEVLFEDKETLDEMVRNVIAQEDGTQNLLSRELPVRGRDGTRLIMDTSVSRVMLEGRLSFLMIMRDITERKEMENSLKERDERFNFIMNGGNDGIWDWNVMTGKIYYSPRLRELLGYDEGEMGSNFKSFDKLLHPEDHDRAMEEVQDHLKTHVPFDTEYRLLTKSGEYKWFGARGRAVWDESGNPVRMAGSISDITKRKETESALHETLLRLRQIFEYTDDAIFFLKPGTCEIIDVNHSAEMLYGYSKAELLALPMESLCAPEHFPLMKSIICNVKQGESAPLDNIINIKKDGTEISVSMRCKIISLQGVDTVYCTFRDITERIRLEREARDIQANLIQANKMTSLGLMVSGVAHEINNPNNFIMANLQFIDMAWSDALKILREYSRENGEFLIAGIPFSQLEVQSPKIFAGLLEGVKRINEIIQTLKRFARQEVPTTDHLVSINETVHAAISILHHEIVKYTENFHLELGEGIPMVKGNSQQLGQVIINLLTNACHSLPSRQHGVWITTGHDTEAGVVIISVRDEGGGIPQELSNKILEPFFTTKLDRGGTGLGLTISNSIIKDHNGILEINSEIGKGTEITVKLPTTDQIGR